MTKKDPRPLRRPQPAVLRALRALGGGATVRQIVVRASLGVNDVSKSLEALKKRKLVRIGKNMDGGDDMWRLRLPRVEPEL